MKKKIIPMFMVFAIALGIGVTAIPVVKAEACSNTYYTGPTGTGNIGSWDGRYYSIADAGTYYSNVKKIQQYLYYINYTTPLAEDGYFGANTKNAVITFQRNHGLSADGIVGSTTWNALRSHSSTINRFL